MSSRRRKGTLLLAGFFVIFSATSIEAQSISFTTLPRDLIENRLKRAPGKNDERKKVLRLIFEEAGCKEDQLTEPTVKGARVPNVICTIPGAADSVIVVGAHFDKVREGEGVVDNWSGASLLPSLFQSVSSQSRRLTFVFVGFTDEERGLVGSTFYLRQLKAEEKAKIRAMVNIHSLGLSSTKVWVSRADKGLVQSLSRLAGALKLPVDGINADDVGDTDSHPFVSSKIPSIDFHSLTQETLPLLHTNKDTQAAIRMDDYYATYRLISAYLVFLDTVLTSSNPPPEEATR